ncbi:MAG: hypothetical protein C0417_00590 [Chlorobiaceae bacterium]|nr:hypothetical protein [Chlorobiaceae bacterium]
MNKITNRVLIFIFGILIVAFAFREIYSPDIGFHIRAGRWILENLRFPGNDIFTYTSSNQNYIDLHWLFQIYAAVVHKLSGEFGLVVTNAILILLSFFLLLIRIKSNGRLSEIKYWQIILFLSITSVAVFFEQRPHIFSWLYFNILLMVLEKSGKNNGKYLFIIPIIMFVWVNTHSLFILGLIVIASYVVGITYRERKIPLKLLLFAVIALAACFINPYFIKGVLLPLQQFQLLQTHNVFKNAISELVTPLSIDSYFMNGRFVLMQPLIWFHLFLIVSVFSFIRRLRTIELQEFLLFGFFLYLAGSAVRNIGFFIFAVTPATIISLQFVSSDRGEARVGNNFLNRIIGKINSIGFQTFWNIAIIIISSVLILSVITNVYYINYRSNDRFGYRFNNQMLPVKGAKFLLDNHLVGKILNHFNFGGFLIYSLPQKIFIDGRTEVIGEEMFYQYSILWNQIDKKPIIDKYNPEIIIFPHQNEFLWVHYLRSDSMWRLTYADELTAVYLRKGYADNIPALKSTTDSGVSIKVEKILKAPYPHNFPLLQFKRHYFPLAELGLSTFYYYNDWFGDAIKVGLDGLNKSTVACPEMYYNLGHYYFELKDFAQSAYCYERFLKTNSDGLASERLKMIRSGKIKVWEEK